MRQIDEKTIVSDDPKDRKLAEGILAHKWGLQDKLPEGHPYKKAKFEIRRDKDEQLR